jgi:hypothetical protein
LLGKCSTTWTMPLVLFCFSYFSGKVLQFLPEASLRPLSSYLCLLHSWDHRLVLHAWLINWDVVSWTFCLSWPQTIILQIFISCVAEIIGMSHHNQLTIFFKWKKLNWEIADLSLDLGNPIINLSSWDYISKRPSSQCLFCASLLVFLSIAGLDGSHSTQLTLTKGAIEGHPVLPTSGNWEDPYC